MNGIVMGVPSLKEIFDPKYYTDLEGGILESFGRLFKNNLKLYVYPMRDPDTGEITTSANLKVPGAIEGLYQFLCEGEHIVPLANYREDVLGIYSPDVLRRIGEQDESWEAMVPDPVARIIKERGLFGFSAK